MDRVDYYYLQLLEENELDLGFTQAEAASRRIFSDQLPPGVLSGLTVAQSSVPALTVDVALGTAYDQAGQRMRVPGTQSVNVALDYLNATTAVTTLGNSKILSVFLKFARNSYDPRPDGNSVTVQFRQDEYFTLYVVQSAEALSPTAPTLASDAILLCDITRAYAATTVVNGNISTTRRQNAWKVTSTPRSLNVGTPLAALSALLGYYNSHVGGSVDKHPAGDLVLSVANQWRDGSSVAANTVDAGFEELVDVLAKADTNDSGADKTGCGDIVGGSSTADAGSLFEVLTQLKSLAKLDYAQGSGTAWVNGVTNGPATGQAAIDRIYTDLASVTHAGRGTGGEKLGMRALGGFTATSVDGYFGQLVAVANGADGAKLVGANATGGFVGVTVRAHLDELRAGGTFSGQVIQGGGLHYGLSSRSVTRMMSTSIISASANLAFASGFGTLPANDAAYQAIEVPHGATITAVTCYINPPNDGVMPGTRPNVQLKKIDITTGTQASIGSAATDPNATIGTYEPVHSFGQTGLSEVVDRTTTTYFAYINGESGANATSVGLLGCSVTFTTTALDDGI